MQRRTIVLLAVLGVALLAVAGAARFVAIRGTVGSPARACVGDEPLTIAFGEPVVGEGARVDVPLRIENRGDASRTILLDHWEVDAYTVRWDGRLSPLGGQRVDIDHVAGYEGDTIPAGGSLSIGSAQHADVEGRIMLVAFAPDACGSGTVRVP